MQLFAIFPRQRPYHVENTSSRPITEVKQRWVWLVLGWVTAWEHQMLLASLFSTLISATRKLCMQLFAIFPRQRPYHVENTSSRPITEVKQRWVWLVLGWVTAWEHQMLLASLFYSLLS